MIDLAAIGRIQLSRAGTILKDGSVYGIVLGSDFSLHVIRWDDGSITDLGSIPSGGIFSDDGVLVGAAPSCSSDGCGPPFTLFTWEDGVMTSLGVQNVSVRDVVDARTFLASTDDDTEAHPVLWHKGTRTDLLGPDTTYRLLAGASVNKHGQVAGTGFDRFKNSARPYVWENGVGRDLGGLADAPCVPNPDTFCPSARVSGMNDQGDIVGWGRDASGTNRAVLWRKGGPIEDIGAFPGRPTTAGAINNRGQILGSSESGLFVWTDGVTLTVGGELRLALREPFTDEGELIGWTDPGDGRTHAAVWRDGQLHDLGVGPAASRAAEAIDINDAGDVLGIYVTEDFVHYLVLWRKLPPVRAAAP